MAARRVLPVTPPVLGTLRAIPGPSRRPYHCCLTTTHVQVALYPPYGSQSRGIALKRTATKQLKPNPVWSLSVSDGVSQAVLKHPLYPLNTRFCKILSSLHSPKDKILIYPDVWPIHQLGCDLIAYLQPKKNRKLLPCPLQGRVLLKSSLHTPCLRVLDPGNPFPKELVSDVAIMGWRRHALLSARPPR